MSSSNNIFRDLLTNNLLNDLDQSLETEKSIQTDLSEYKPIDSENNQPDFYLEYFTCKEYNKKLLKKNEILRKKLKESNTKFNEELEKRLNGIHSYFSNFPFILIVCTISI